MKNSNRESPTLHYFKEPAVPRPRIGRLILEELATGFVTLFGLVLMYGAFRMLGAVLAKEYPLRSLFWVGIFGFFGAVFVFVGVIGLIGVFRSLVGKPPGNKWWDRVELLVRKRR
jgi:hypothetical protein